MSGQMITRLDGRNICYHDELGVLHQCKGFRLDRRTRLFWTLCNRDAPADKVHAQARGEALTCPECHWMACEQARRIWAASAIRPRPTVGGLPFKPDLD
ncbi:MAG: hypothetical protein F9K29_05750 [Hyphomicrobiaceae bacterium]|nr:MAG: hypothetical protein F9K29_05750 [Hyphomicrobiaceae bacterium]